MQPNHLAGAGSHAADAQLVNEALPNDPDAEVDSDSDIDAEGEAESEEGVAPPILGRAPTPSS